MADSTITAKGQPLPGAKSDVIASSTRFDLLMGVPGMVFVGDRTWMGGRMHMGW